MALPGFLGSPCPPEASRAQKAEDLPPTGHSPAGEGGKHSPLSPEEKHKGLEEGPEVVVLSNLEVILITVLVLHIDANVAKHLGDWRVMTRDTCAPQWLQGTPINAHVCLSDLGSPDPTLPTGSGPPWVALGTPWGWWPALTCIPMMA